MSPFLLDTNICIYLMKGLHGLSERTRDHAANELLISEVTLAELIFGIAKSDRPLGNRATLDRFLVGVTITPIIDVLETFAFEKARLARAGAPISDFDLLIGATAIHHDLTLVTNNTRHFQRLQGIKLEDWTK